MARMPAAKWLGEHSPRTPMERYDIVCVHTLVGFAPAHAAHFSTHSDGRIEQSRDTKYRSAANLDGNHRVIAIENEDHGEAFPDWGGSNVPKLTDAQITACAKILAWAHKTHGVPLQLCPNSKPGSRGLAVHRQGIDGNFTLPLRTRRLPRSMWLGRVTGGEHWSTSFGKVCPGDRRIAQLPAILKRAKQIVNGDWFDMATKADLAEVVENKVAPLRAELKDFRGAFAKFREVLFKRDKALAGEIRAIAAKQADQATQQRLNAVATQLSDQIDLEHP